MHTEKLRLVKDTFSTFTDEPPSTLMRSKARIHLIHLPRTKLFLLAARSVFDALLLHVLLQFVFPSLLLRLFRRLFRLWTGEPIAETSTVS